MNFDEFMKDPYQEEVGGLDFKTIARVIVHPCFQGWAFGSGKNFPYTTKKDAERAYEQCVDYCQGENSFPQKGLLTVVIGDDVPTHPDGTMMDWDDFVPIYHSKEKYTGKVNVTGEYPYDLVLAGLQANPSVFNEEQWCQLARKIDNVREPGRDKENSKYARTVYVVEKVFANREEAYKAAGKNPDSSDEDAFIDFGNPTLSKYAIENGWTLENLLKQKGEIQEAIKATMRGENTPDGKPLKDYEAKKVVCEGYLIDPADLELLDGTPIDESEAPF